MDFIIIWQEGSLGAHILDSLNKKTKKMATLGGAYFHYVTYSTTLKNLLLQNASKDFIIIWQECSLDRPIRDSLKKFGSGKKHGRRRRGLFQLYDI